AVDVVDTSVWVGTSAHLIRYHLDEHHVEQIPVTAIINGLHGDPSGVLWVAIANGLARHANGRLDYMATSEARQVNRPTAVTATRDGTVWVCDYDTGLFRWSKATMTRVGVGSDLRDKACTCAYTTNTDDVWIGFAAGQVLVHHDGVIKV